MRQLCIHTCFFFSLLVSAIRAAGQSNQCTDLLKTISVKWKKDSLLKDGFRYSIHNQIISCNKFEITAKELVEYLGKPKEIKKWSAGKEKRISYSYDYFYEYTDSGEKPWSGLVISFNFDESGQFLSVTSYMWCS